MAYTQGVTTIANLTTVLTGALSAQGWTNVSGSVWGAPAFFPFIQINFSTVSTSSLTLNTQTVQSVTRTHYLLFGTNTSTGARVEYQAFVGSDYAVFVVRAPVPGTLGTQNTSIQQTTFGITTIDPYSDAILFDVGDHVAVFGHTSLSTSLSNSTLYMRNGNVDDGWVPSSLSTMRVAAGSGLTAGIPDNTLLSLGSTQTTFWPYLLSVNPGVTAPVGGGLVGRLNNVFFAGDNVEDVADTQKPVNIRSVIDGATYRSVIPFRNVSTVTPLGFSTSGIGGPIIMVKE